MPNFQLNASLGIDRFFTLAVEYFSPSGETKRLTGCYFELVWMLDTPWTSHAPLPPDWCGMECKEGRASIKDRTWKRPTADRPRRRRRKENSFLQRGIPELNWTEISKEPIAALGSKSRPNYAWSAGKFQPKRELVGLPIEFCSGVEFGSFEITIITYCKFHFKLEISIR